METVYRETKMWDSTRPCIDTSGNYHVMTDIFDVHDYDQDAEAFTKRYLKLKQENVLEPWEKRTIGRQEYQGEPFFVSEFGGIRWDENGDSEGWGYGDEPKSKEEFILRLKGLTDALLENDKIFGFCYTQLYDVEQEINGLYTYSRKAKFDSKILSEIIAKKAKIED